jgi:pimeloyl-ACP methyl ester carboxylesterase
MKTIYKSKQSEIAMMDLYDRQLKAFNMDYEDLFVDTRFGKTYVVKIGNQTGNPLIVFHGSNNTMPYELSFITELLSHFCVYSVDTVGHPGKSSQTVVSLKTMEYGEWASDVITELGFQKINCLGAGIGGGILIKLMCIAPEKVAKSVLIVPAGIAKATTLKAMALTFSPMMKYIKTKDEEWLKKVLLPMAIEESRIDEADVEMLKYSVEHVGMNVRFPSIAKAEDLRKFTAPIFIIVAEYDRMFPSKKILAKAQKTILNLKTHILKGQGQMFSLSDGDITMIKEFFEN